MKDEGLTSETYEGVAQGPFVLPSHYPIRAGDSPKKSTQGETKRDHVSVSGAYELFRNKISPWSAYSENGIASQDFLVDEKSFFTRQRMHESPLQRVERLKAEVSEVMRFVETTVQGSTPEAAKLTGDQSLVSFSTSEQRLSSVDPESFMLELEEMLNQLNSLNVSEKSQCGSLADRPNDLSSAAVEEKILDLLSLVSINHKFNRKSVMSSGTLDLLDSHLSMLQSNLEKTCSENQPHKALVETSKSSLGTIHQPFSYEIYSTHSCAADSHITQLLDLERRVTELESLIGVNTSSHLVMPYPDIASGVTDLANGLLLVNSKNLDYIVERFKHLNVQLDDFLKSKERLLTKLMGNTSGWTRPGSAESSMCEAIEDLYTFCHSACPTMAALPLILKRLNGLMTVHLNASNMTQRLDELENEQKEMDNSLHCLEQDVTSIKTCLSETLSRAKEMVEALRKKHEE